MKHHLRLALGFAALAAALQPLAAQSIYMPYNFITIAGGGAGSGGYADGTGSAADFNIPEGGAISSAGNLFVADTGNNTIRELTPTVTGGVTTWTSTTLAGLATQAHGAVDGIGSAARFYNPIGIAVDTNNALYVADLGNGAVRKVVPSVSGGVTTWTVSTLATGFNAPAGVAVDSNGNVYVDEENPPDTIYKISPGGVVTPFAGQAGGPGYVDGPGSSALFNNPFQLAIDGSGNLFVADAKNRLVRKITPAGVVSTVVGIYGEAGDADGAVATATLGELTGVAVDSSDNVYACGIFYANVNFGDTIRLITAGGEVSTLGGVAGVTGFANGLGSAALFNTPTGLAVDSHGNVFVADAENAAIREGSPPAVAPTITQAASPSSVTIDPGRSVAFNAQASGTPAPSYQWTLNGSATIPGAANTTDPILLITGAAVSNIGTYTCTATNTAGTATTSATLTVQATGNPARLVNLSARAEDLTGGNILIAGLSVGGSGAEPVLIRGVGPFLAGTPFDISNYLPNPVITLFDHQSQPIVSDRGWGNVFTPGSSSVNVSPSAATVSLMNQVGAFLIPTASLDSAMEIQILPGNYTMELTDANGAAGVGLAEVYDAGNSSSPTRLANISARADVGAGGDILIGGLVVTGGSGETVLLRAVGPGLVNQGLPANGGLLAQPSLALYQGSTEIYSNTGWGSDPVIQSAFNVVGATNLLSADSAVLLTLPAGAYTVLVSGAGGSSGIGLVEVFEIY